MYPRCFSPLALLEQKSIFLLGPRQVGKSTLLRTRLPDAVYVDLLEADTFRELSAQPERMRQRLRPQDHTIVVDEVQKLPSLLDEVQALIDRNKSLRFVLTGSSARKLKRGHANLLAGRAWFARLHPLISKEVGAGRLLEQVNRGGLPAVLDSPSPDEDLRAYVGTYLQEEIRGEGLTRAIEPFSRFLTVAGLSNGEQLNFTAIGGDAGVPPRTVREYYQLLEDTLVGHMLPPFQKTVRRKPVATSKFYLFDVGVANALARRTHIQAGSSEYGRVVEHQVFLELRAYLDYHRRDDDLCYWRSRGGMEVDFIVGDGVAIEVKATGRVTDRDLKGLRALREDVRLRTTMVVCREKTRRTTDDGILILSVEEFLASLWNGEML